MIKKYKPILLMLLFVISLFLMSGIINAKGKLLEFDEVNDYSFYDWKMRISDEVQEWVDKDTGVHYLIIFDDNTVRCMSPRYDKNGKVMVDKK